MSWMNTWDIDEAYARHRHHPVLGPATRTLASLRDAADQNSDGWCYWPKPANAAKKLMDLIQYDKNGQRRQRWDEDTDDVTEADVRAALRPIKAFRTRSGISFRIYENNSVCQQCEGSGTAEVVRLNLTLDPPTESADGMTSHEAARIMLSTVDRPLNANEVQKVRCPTCHGDGWDSD